MDADIFLLARKLTSSDLSSRRSAAEILAGRGPGAAAAAMELARAAGDLDEVVREWSASALEELGPPREADLAGIADLLEHTPGDTAYWAATLLGRSETAADAYIPRLADALRTRREVAVRERIVWALGRIGPSAAAAAIASTARDPSCPPRLARLCRETLQSVDPPPLNPETPRPYQLPLNRLSK